MPLDSNKLDLFANVRPAILPALAHVIGARDFFTIHESIRQLFAVCYTAVADTYDARGLYPDTIDHDRALRVWIPVAAATYLIAAVEDEALCEPCTKEYVSRVMELFRYRVDTSWPLDAHEQPHELLLTELVVALHREDLPHLALARSATWSPPIAPGDCTAVVAGRTKRLDQYRERKEHIDHVTVSNRRIFQSAPCSSREFYAWLNGKLSDDSKASKAIERVLAGTTPLCSLGTPKVPN